MTNWLADFEAERAGDLRESLGLNDEFVIARQETRDLENPCVLLVTRGRSLAFLRREQYGNEARDWTLLRIRSVPVTTA